MWGHAPASVSDEGRVHSQNSKSLRLRIRVVPESSVEAGAPCLAWRGDRIRGGSAFACRRAANLRRGRRRRDSRPARAYRPISASSNPARTSPAAAPPRAARPIPPTPSRLSSGNMDFKRELDFKIGNSIFRKNWVSAPASTDASDGLGPLFNSRACQNLPSEGRARPSAAFRRCARRIRARCWSGSRSAAARRRTRRSSSRRIASTRCPSRPMAASSRIARSRASPPRASSRSITRRKR